MISIRKKMDESEQVLAALKALRKAFVQLVTTLPKAALPANPELSEQCKDNLGAVTSALSDTSGVREIEAAAQSGLQHIEQIFHSNRAALADRDQALKDVVDSVAQAVSGFKGRGARHESNLGQLADGFETLSRINDPDELRSRLRLQVGKLRTSAEEMRREMEQSVAEFETQVSSYQKRLESARKETGLDRLTGLGSRREAERHLRRIPKIDGPACLLVFDVEGFGAINTRLGTPFGDKLLRTLGHTLTTAFPDPDSVFRWGADEFVVIAVGSQKICANICQQLCDAFYAGRKYFTVIDGGQQVPLAARVAFGAAQYSRGETMEDLYRRSRAALEENRRALHR
jgi:diguanylate cyclase (GGDEF)-like protein